MPGFYLQGLVFDDPQPRKTLRTVKLDLDEVPSTIASLIGKPVLLDHAGPAIGKVLSAHISASGDLLVNIFIDTVRPRGAEARRGVRAGDYRGLSFGSLTVMDEDAGVRYTKHVIREVSVVPDGAVPRSRIVFWGDHRHDIHGSLAKFHDVFTKSLHMSSESKPVAPEFKPDLPVEMSKDQMIEAAKIFSTLNEIGLNTSNIKAFSEVAKRVLSKSQAEFQTFVNGNEKDKKIGFVQYAHETGLTDVEMEQLQEELKKEACEMGGRMTLKVAASLLSNYQELQRKGEAAQQKTADKPQDPPRRVPTETKESVAEWTQNNLQCLSDAFASVKKVKVGSEKPEDDKAAIASRITSTKVSVKLE